MSQEFYTVEFAAEQLKLHPKTVLKFIRQGQLRATKVGRQYRILRSDLAALVGDHRPARSTSREVRSTTIVDISNADAEFARRMAALLTGARKANGP
ncbi:helix-turn-helix domain-containing protein, partial [Mesorhizobium sp. Primo-B]|uniref:helix-turn-helix domain-containing protein n=1 Tax=Mesorhizobium sp. Primo-B TaxID=2496781 RepID=UPI000FD4922B